MTFLAKKQFFSIALAIGGLTALRAQDADHTKSVATSEYQWHHGDASKDGVIGISSTKAYEELLVNKKSSKVVVAIIDSGTETFHPDLAPQIWNNTDEIAGNNVDDDKNGYIDDSHGWSFIGGKGGDVDADLLEFTRIYKGLHTRFNNKEASAISDADKKDFERYQRMKADYEDRIGKAKQEQAQVFGVKVFYETANAAMTQKLGVSPLTMAALEAYTPADDSEKQYREFLMICISEDLMSQMVEWEKHVNDQLDYQLSLDFDPRSMVGDDYSNPNERIYGNNHIDGPSADHGTHVAGIVGADRNGFGMDGIADNVELMVIRCVPNGDERDKDVANAIRYAVDNGARVINMSFGKSFSPEKFVVDEAVRYAESKGVLLVHAAGNDAKNIDKEANFPTKFYENKKACKTWIEVGASGPELNTLPAPFSNYGVKEVDVFAPGVDIYSTVPGNKYQNNSGTSMAAPVTAGIAAALFSYYPELTAKDVRAIILKSSVKYKKTEVLMPGEETKQIKFNKLSATGGVVNLYNALQMAATWKPGSAK